MIDEVRQDEVQGFIKLVVKNRVVSQPLLLESPLNEDFSSLSALIKGVCLQLMTSQLMNLGPGNIKILSLLRHIVLNIGNHHIVIWNKLCFLLILKATLQKNNVIFSTHQTGLYPLCHYMGLGLGSGSLLMIIAQKMELG